MNQGAFMQNKNIRTSLASEKDKDALVGFFKHYKIENIIRHRVSCYLTHNFTVVAKDEDKIVGILQWYVKENPQAGVVEFEEIYILDGYRSEGIGSTLIKFAIQSVRDYFQEIGIRPRKIFLFVNKENKIARALFEKHNFKSFSGVGNLFLDTQEELFYSLDL